MCRSPMKRPSTPSSGVTSAARTPPIRSARWSTFRPSSLTRWSKSLMAKKPKRKRSSAATRAAGKAAEIKLLPKEAYAPNGMPYYRARLKNPNNPCQFYRASGVAGRVWVEVGYDTWDLEDWRTRYGTQHPDGRPWDFFGDPIDIWLGYSDE